MYRGYKIEEDIKAFLDVKYQYYYTIGKARYNQQLNDVQAALNEFYLEDGTINGRELKEKWFPKINANVFLSHSHKDKKDIIALAGFLFEEFELVSFIDSTVWGYANDLLKEIDDLYCKNKESNIYDYDKRNYSTSHIHLMLNTSLLEIMDNSECVIFVDTPNSIQKVSQTISNGTFSPWIYSELNLMKFHRINPPKRFFEKRASFSQEQKNEILNESLQILHDVESPLECLADLKLNHLNILLQSRIYNKKHPNESFAEQNLNRLYKVVQKKTFQK